MQAARPRENHRRARIDADGLVALAVEIGQRPASASRMFSMPRRLCSQELAVGVFEIEHHAGSAGIQHLHHEFGVIGRTGHLVALIRAPRRQLDAPGICRGHRRRQVVRKLAGVRFNQGAIAAGNESTLARGERSMEWHEEFNEVLREIARGIKVGRGGVDRNAAIPMGWRLDCRAHLCGRCSHALWSIPSVDLPQN